MNKAGLCHTSEDGQSKPDASERHESSASVAPVNYSMVSFQVSKSRRLAMLEALLRMVIPHCTPLSKLWIV